MTVRAIEPRAAPGRGWGHCPRPGGRSGAARRCRRAERLHGALPPATHLSVPGKADDASTCQLKKKSCARHVRYSPAGFMAFALLVRPREMCVAWRAASASIALVCEYPLEPRGRNISEDARIVTQYVGFDRALCVGFATRASAVQ